MTRYVMLKFSRHRNPIPIADYSEQTPLECHGGDLIYFYDGYRSVQIDAILGCAQLAQRVRDVYIE